MGQAAAKLREIEAERPRHAQAQHMRDVANVNVGSDVKADLWTRRNEGGESGTTCHLRQGSQRENASETHNFSEFCSGDDDGGAGGASINPHALAIVPKELANDGVKQGQEIIVAVVGPVVFERDESRDGIRR